MTSNNQPLRIFVVDDHKDVAEGLADVLRMHGHEVTVAFNGEQAIRIFRDHDFDIAFMDVMMPGMNGVESFLEIRKIKPAAKVIMMTGYSVEQLLDQAVDNGAYGVLHKPVAMDDVLEAVERVKSQGMVLVADDDPDFSASVKDVLEGRGYRVCLARTGSEALKTVLGGGVDILVLDLQLPVISGLEVYMQLRKRGRAVPTVVVTGHSQEQAEAIDTLRSVTETGILTKPFASHQLFEEIEKLASERRGSDQDGIPEAQAAPAPMAGPPLIDGGFADAPAPQPAVAPEPPMPSFEPAQPAPVQAEPAWPAEPAAPAFPPPAPEFDTPKAVPAAPVAPELSPIPAVQPMPEAAAPPAPKPAPPPLAPAAAAPRPKARADNARSGRILAVDDDKDLVDGLADVLRTRGYTVKTAYTAESAREIIGEFDAQVALLDIRLGKSNGLDLIPVLKAEQPNIYCVMITGNADKESAITALRVGAHDYLTKPLHPHELFAILDRCLEKYDLQQRLDQAFDALQQSKNEAEGLSRKGCEFLARLTDELTNPIAEIVSSATQTIDEQWGPVGAPQYKDQAVLVRDNATQVLDTLKCSLDLAKAQAGTLELNEDKVDMGALMSSSVRLILDSVNADMPQIEVKTPEMPLIVWGDQRQFEQMLLQLLSNAVKFTPEDGQIKLSLDLDPQGNMIFEICDTGVGMPSSAIETALEQFGRVDSPDGRKFPGAGLGLSLVKAIAELHGGQLKLESEPNNGTIASVTIPAQRVDTKGASAPATEAPNIGVA